MGSDLEWKEKVVEKPWLEEGRKVEKEYLPKLSSKDDQVQKSKSKQRLCKNFKKKETKYKILYDLLW